MNNFVQATAPTADQGVAVGDLWTQPATGEMQVCRAVRPAVDWVQTLGSSVTVGKNLVVGGSNDFGLPAGNVIIPNASAIRGVDTASSGSFVLVKIDSNNRMQISQTGTDIVWSPAPVALGGGAAPTLGTIGGSGPAVAAQNGWTRFIDNAGNVRFWPNWA